MNDYTLDNFFNTDLVDLEWHQTCPDVCDLLTSYTIENVVSAH